VLCAWLSSVSSGWASISAFESRNTYIFVVFIKNMKSVFLKLEGCTVRNRIWDFLIIHQEFDYSMKDIARFSEVSYTALKDVWKELIERKIVVNTRDVGKAKMYKLNLESLQVQNFVKYYWSVVDSEVEQEMEKEAILV
jgi:hypothetical protein